MRGRFGFLASLDSIIRKKNKNSCYVNCRNLGCSVLEIKEILSDVKSAPKLHLFIHSNKLFINSNNYITFLSAKECKFSTNSPAKNAECRMWNAQDRRTGGQEAARRFLPVQAVGLGCGAWLRGFTSGLGFGASLRAYALSTVLRAHARNGERLGKGRGGLGERLGGVGGGKARRSCGSGAGGA